MDESIIHFLNAFLESSGAPEEINENYGIARRLVRAVRQVMSAVWSMPLSTLVALRYSWAISQAHWLCTL